MVDWQWSSFDELSCRDLYEILKVRQAVFIVEQDCVYLDTDDVDQSAWHLLGWGKDAAERTLIAYLRVVFPGVKYPEPSIGRVLTVASMRRQGLGKALTREALDHIAQEYPGQAMRISAQQYLSAFYAGFGFEAVSDPYDEDGIPHIEMLRTAVL